MEQLLQLTAHRAAIVAKARLWVGTPYHHQASCLGAGADCLGLLRGVWREVLGAEPLALPSYTSDWGEVDGGEQLLEGLARAFDPVGADIHAGQVLVFRMRARAVAKHVGIVGVDPLGSLTLIHAFSRSGVVEASLSESWKRKIAGRFEFPYRRP